MCFSARSVSFLRTRSQCENQGYESVYSVSITYQPGRDEMASNSRHGVGISSNEAGGEHIVQHAHGSACVFAEVSLD